MTFKLKPNTINMKRLLLIVFFLPFALTAQINFSTNPKPKRNHFAIVDGNSLTTIVFDEKENILLEKAARFLADDIEKVTGKKPNVKTNIAEDDKILIVVGTIGNNHLIDELIASKKLNVDEINGQWERFVIQTIKNQNH